MERPTEPKPELLPFWIESAAAVRSCAADSDGREAPTLSPEPFAGPCAGPERPKNKHLGVPDRSACARNFRFEQALQSPGHQPNANGGLAAPGMQVNILKTLLQNPEYSDLLDLLKVWEIAGHLDAYSNATLPRKVIGQRAGHSIARLGPGGEGVLHCRLCIGSAHHFRLDEYIQCG